MTTCNASGNKLTDGTSNITLGGDLITSGAYATTITATGTTNITIPTSGTLSNGTLAVTNVTGTSAAMTANNAYVANNAALVTLALPTTGAVGDVVEICGAGAGGWAVSQAASQYIRFASGGSTLSTTVGVGGSIASTTAADCITLKCIVINNGWEASDMVGNITVV